MGYQLWAIADRPPRFAICDRPDIRDRAPDRPRGLSILPQAKIRSGNSGNCVDGCDVHHERCCAVLDGVGDIRFSDGERFIVSARDFKEWSGLREGLAIKTTQGITVITAVIVVAILFWFLNKTRTGKSMRAFSDNEDLALLSGINPEKVVMVTWLIVAALATVAGTLYGLDKSFKPFVYLQLLLPIFAAAIVGGLGNPLGAIAGGFVIAFAEVTITYPLKKILGYLLPESLEPDGLVQLLSTDYKFAVSFVILLIVLLVKPTGLFKGQSV